MSRFWLVVMVLAMCVPAHAADVATVASEIKVSGSVDDPSGATVAGAQVELLDQNGGLVVSTTTPLNGQFQITAPPGDYQLAVIRDGFATSVLPLHLHNPGPAPLIIRLKIAELSQEVNVDASAGVPVTDPGANKDAASVTAEDLKSVPVFDNDYIAALSTLLDTGDVSSGGTTVLIDGMEKNRVGVSTSAIQSVKINNDPYSAEFYQPGRGQIQVTTKPAADAFHGSLNFTFRDATFDARNAFAPHGTKPPEQRRIYYGELTGPIFRVKDTSFLFSFTRAEEDLQAVVNATTPAGPLRQNVAAPTRDSEFSLRVARQLSPSHTGYVEYQFQDQSNTNEGVGDLTLAEAGTNVTEVESDILLHDDYTLSPTKLNQLAVLVELNHQDIANTHQGSKIVVQGAFSGGSAQGQQTKSEYNLRVTDAFSYTRGKQQMKFGINLPHIGRRLLEDQSLFGGKYTFANLAAYQAGTPSTYEAQQGQIRYVYHDQEAGVFFLDVIQMTPTLTITPGLRYDWNNFTRDSVTNFSPRFSVAKLLDKNSATVLRAGVGVYYDRAGAGPLVDLKRYSRPSLVDVLVTQNPCYPVICPDQIAQQAPNIVRLDPNARTPVRFNASVSLERSVGKNATASATYYNAHTYDAYRSVDINAPLPFSNTRSRPNPAFGRYRQIQTAGSARTNTLTLALRGRIGNIFSGIVQYNYGHSIDDTGGIGSFPQNQYAPEEESDSNHDARHRLNMFGTFRQGKPLNLGVQLHLSNGAPYTITTGTDPYGTGFFNARPAGVARNSKNAPAYEEVDLRYNYDFKLRRTQKDKSPTLGFSLSAFNILNRVNASAVSSVQSSPTFGQVIGAYPPRRMQLELNYAF